MQFGIDRLVEEDFALLRGKRVGLFTNLPAVDAHLNRTYDLFCDSPEVDVRVLFAPEHGMTATVADAMEVSDVTDSRTGLPVYSLYGKTFRPTAAMLEGIDVLVCDIQDIGLRFYTYLWTVTHILEACGENGVPVMILDRPNPLGGTVDGGGLEPDQASFVGRHPIPIQHGMTMGELALLFNAFWNHTPAEIEIITCKGWRRSMTWPQIGRPFVPPSPGMPHFSTALHYPGACLIEGTTLSEGRGTPLPFEVVGAPGINSRALADELNNLCLPGVRFRPHEFEPLDSKHAGKLCGGVQAHIVDGSSYRPLTVWLGLLRLMRQEFAEYFDWLPPFKPGGLVHFDRLIGTDRVRKMIDAGESVEAMTADWETFHQEFLTQRAPYLLYED